MAVERPIAALIGGQIELRTAARLNVDGMFQRLTAIRGTVDKLEIARLLYQYVQKNTRYVLININDGGWSPLATSVVHQNKYGDCKALTHYYNSLCQAYDIKASLVLVNAGDTKIDAKDDFYSTVQFNHAISKIEIFKPFTKFYIKIKLLLTERKKLC